MDFYRYIDNKTADLLIQNMAGDCTCSSSKIFGHIREGSHYVCHRECLLRERLLYTIIIYSIAFFSLILAKKDQGGQARSA